MYKIILAEDNAIIRENITTYLQMLGYDCKAFQNGKEALDAINIALPDLVICDIMMPVMDGYQVFKALKKNNKTLALPVIFLTAKADKIEIEKGFGRQVDYLTKPFAIGDLLALVQEKIPMH